MAAPHPGGDRRRSLRDRVRHLQPLRAAHRRGAVALTGPSPETPATEDLEVTDTSRAGPLVIRGAFLRLLGYAAGSVFGIVTAVLLTRHLGVDRFGQYTTIISVATLAVMATDAGVSTLATREFVSRDPRRHQILSDLFGLRLTFSGLAIVGAGVFAVLAGYDDTRIIGTLVATLGLGVASIQAFSAVPLMARLRLGWVSAIELLRQGALVVLIVICVAAGAGLLPILAALVPSSVLALVVTVTIAGDASRLRPTFHAERVMPLVRATAVFSIATSLGVFYAFATQVITSLVASPQQTGLFAAAFRLFSVVAASGGLLINSAFPLLARSAQNDRDRLAYALQKLFDVSVILGMTAAIAAITGAEAIIKVIAGPNYAASAPILQIEGAALLASFLVAVLAYTLISLRRHVALVVTNALALIVTVSLTLLLAPDHGGRGAAVAVVAGEWSLALSSWIALARFDRTLLPRPAVVVKALAAAAPAFAVMALGLPSAVQFAAALGIYGVGILVLRAVPPEVKDLVPRGG